MAVGCFSNWLVLYFSKVEPDGWVTVHVPWRRDLLLRYINLFRDGVSCRHIVNT